MPNNPTLAEINFNLKFAKKINQTTIDQSEMSIEPAVNIDKKNPLNKGLKPVYVVNIFTYIPENIEQNQVAKKDNQLVIFENSILFKYRGVKSVETEINTKISGNEIPCRNFKIVFEGPDNQTTFDLYHIQFEYQVSESTQSVEGIWVRDRNLDPRTDRGTVTTPRYP